MNSSTMSAAAKAAMNSSASREPKPSVLMTCKEKLRNTKSVDKKISAAALIQAKAIQLSG